MDPTVEQLVLGIVANGLSSVLGRILGRAGVPESLDAAVTRSTAEYLARSGDSLGAVDEARLAEFLDSSQARLVVEQLFAGGLDAPSRTTSEIREEFVALWSWTTGDDGEEEEEIARVFDVLAHAIDRALEAAIEQGVLSAADARGASRHREVMSSLRNVARVAAMISAPSSVSSQELADYSAVYLQQVLEREGKITPPSFESARKVPLDDLYVRPVLVEGVDGNSSTHPPESDSELPHRTVVLGNPGGGKSTLAKKAVIDAARKALAGATNAVPFIVVLRDFATFKEVEHTSIATYIEATSSSHYQVGAPPGAVEQLLTTGQAVVVFDGLDELLETERRQEISADIESFATRFPATPVLVTSREIGYVEAPLDEHVWRTFRLADFTDEKVEEYMAKWLALDPELSQAQQEADVAGFMDESEDVPDLRSNPLMLALMCSLYRGAGYIPRNRPDVYEQCSVMLFERWDSKRRISVPLGFEAHLRPAMRFLAHWIYTNVGLQGGVREDRLVELAAEYLLDHRFDDPEEARLEAEKFIRFCRGRAWVFTDMGADGNGRRLYQFTHRTFLEYFTAEYLAGRYATPESLVDFLRPRIVKTEWDEVCQLALQIKEKHVSGSADKSLRLLVQLVEEAPDDPSVERALDFAARALAFLVPRPRTTRLIAGRVVDAVLTWAVRLSPDAQRHSRDPRLPFDVLLSAMSAAPDNQQAVAAGVTETLIKRVDDSKPIVAAELALNIGHLTGHPRFCQEVPAAVIESCRLRLRELARIQKGVAVDLVVWDCLTIEELVAWHGFAGLFEAPTLQPIPVRRRTGVNAWMVAGIARSDIPRLPGDSGRRATEGLRSVAGLFLADDTLCFRVGGSFVGLTWPLFWRRSDGPPPFDSLDRDQRFALIMLMASIVEEARVSDEANRGRHEGEIPGLLEDIRAAEERMGPGGKVILGWADEVADPQLVAGLELTAEQADLVAGWMERRVQLAR